MIIERHFGRQSQRVNVCPCRGHRQILGSHHYVEQQSDSRGHDSREERIKQCLPEDTPRVLLPSEHGERGDDGQRYGGHGQQLEQPRIDRSHEIHQAIKPFHAQQPQHSTRHEGANP